MVGLEVRILSFQDWGWGEGERREGRDAFLKVTRDWEGRTAQPSYLPLEAPRQGFSRLSFVQG